MSTLYERLLAICEDQNLKRSNRSIEKIACISSGRVTQIKADPTAKLSQKSLECIAKLGYSLQYVTNGKLPMRICDINIKDGPELRGSVPLISWVQAGMWQEAIDNLQVGQGEIVETSYKARRHTYALRVVGDSMEPKFPDGCIIIVEPEESPEPGKYVIIKNNGGEATLKQLVSDGGVYYLKPINPRYPIMKMEEDSIFCGVVKRIEMDV